MMKLSIAFALAAALTAGCMTARYGDTAAPVPGKPDTFAFKIWPNAFVTTEDFIFKQLQPDLEEFRIRQGYSSFEVVERMCQPMGACTYAVRFVR